MKRNQILKTLFVLAAFFMLLLYPASNSYAAVESDSNTPSVKVGCEYKEINTDKYGGQEFKNPDTIDFSDGETATLEVGYMRGQIAGCDVHLRSYIHKTDDSDLSSEPTLGEGEYFVGPTLRARPGDTIRINLINNLPPDGSHQKSALKPDDCGIFEPTGTDSLANQPHGFNRTNFHAHGLHVSPSGCSDNVLRVMNTRNEKDDPAPSYNVTIKIPDNHPAGTFWYHAHIHGATAIQVSSGMAGALIIDGGYEDEIPEIAATKDNEKVFVFQQIAYDTNGEVESYDKFGPRDWQNSKRQITVNGQIVPVIYVQPGEVQRWRFIQSGIRESLNIRLWDPSNVTVEDKPNTFTFVKLHEIAVDGLPLSKLDSWKTIDLEPGYRSDVLFKADELAPGEEQKVYYLLDARSSGTESLLGVKELANVLAKVVVQGSPVDMDLPEDEQLAQIKEHYEELQDITDDEITGGIQLVNFSLEVPSDDNAPLKYVVNNQEFGFDHKRILQLNAAEKWLLTTDENSGAPTHPFHIHVNPFQYTRKGPDGHPENIWRDTLVVSVGKAEEIRTRYKDFDGMFVVHCHILDHEDQGMMELVQIVDRVDEQ